MEDTDTDKALLDRMRSVALGDDEDDKRLVEHKGVTYEVRAPTIQEAKALQRRALVPVLGADKKPLRGPSGAPVLERDDFLASVLLIINSTYVPGTQTRVFTAADRERLMGMRNSARSLTTKLLAAINSFQEEDVAEGEDALEAAEKNSGSGHSS